MGSVSARAKCYAGELSMHVQYLLSCGTLTHANIANIAIDPIVLVFSKWRQKRVAEFTLPTLPKLMHLISIQYRLNVSYNAHV